LAFYWKVFRMLPLRGRESRAELARSPGADARLHPLGDEIILEAPSLRFGLECLANDHEEATAGRCRLGQRESLEVYGTVEDILALQARHMASCISPDIASCDLELTDRVRRLRAAS